MYARSLAVVVLCTIFVLAFVLVLNYDTAGIGAPGTKVPTTQTTCPASEPSCERLTITSASIHVVNYTDELGIVTYATLSLGLNASGEAPISRVNLFVGNSSAGQIQGPFNPGVNRIVNTTLPATISVSPGKTYVVVVEGEYGNSPPVWTSTRVTAQ